ncbi:hypothetical protein [Colwellia psychrerythraea]|uniref:Lipid A biosynthesis acyltransferase n=1 Tax=Colwellia psychrerythraea TaxID=28229 RepID=A0A099KEI0_COLPS|nr:hypothetical protein [Colwellia psychrerythraea]KGJ89139.1 lipid A biosynthesis acyltransferase [Colwellia psychrerythraea]
MKAALYVISIFAWIMGYYKYIISVNKTVIKYNLTYFFGYSNNKAEIDTIKHFITFSRGQLLQRWYGKLSPKSRIKFITEFVDYKIHPQALLLAKSNEGAIIITPHQSIQSIAAIGLSNFLTANKSKLGTFFDSKDVNSGNAKHLEVFDSDEEDILIFHNNTRDLVKSIRSLRNGMWLSMYPDIFQYSSAFIAVPMFNKIMAGMSGIEYMVSKTGAAVVSGVADFKNGRLEIKIHEPIRPELLKSDAVSKLVYTRLEKCIREQPYNWQYLSQMKQYLIVDHPIETVVTIKTEDMNSPIATV